MLYEKVQLFESCRIYNRPTSIQTYRPNLVGRPWKRFASLSVAPSNTRNGEIICISICLANDQKSFLSVLNSSQPSRAHGLETSSIEPREPFSQNASVKPTSVCPTSKKILMKLNPALSPSSRLTLSTNAVANSNFLTITRLTKLGLNRRKR